jgi:hypothetical protein
MGLTAAEIRFCKSKKTHIYIYLHLAQQPHRYLTITACGGAANALQNLVSILILVVLGCAKSFGVREIFVPACEGTGEGG